MRLSSRILILFALGIGVLPQLHSQAVGCEPLGTPDERWNSYNSSVGFLNSSILSQVDITQIYKVGIAIHLVGPADGTGLVGDTQLQAQIALLQGVFLTQAKIQFLVVRQDTILNNAFITRQPAINDEMARLHNIVGAINIYFVDGGDALATFSPRQMSWFNQWMPGSAVGDPESTSQASSELSSCQRAEQYVLVPNFHDQVSTIVHEFGHIFDLFHVWETMVNSSLASNDYESGDLISQTAFTTAPVVSESCSPTDARFALAKNFMSGAFLCRNEFTTEQVQRMRHVLLNRRPDLLQNWIRMTNVAEGPQDDNAGDKLKVTQDAIQQEVISGFYANLVANRSAEFLTLKERFVNYKQTSVTRKHRYWDPLPNLFRLSFSQTVQQGVEQKAMFSEILPATVQSTLVEGPVCGNILFCDPWYVAVDGTQPSALMSFPSPHLPTGAFNCTSGGVFLRQNPSFDPALPIYSLKAPSTQSNMSGFTGCFFKWDTVGAAVQNVSSPDSQGVVFRQTNAVVTAKYKAHLGSNASSVTSGRGQRRLAYDEASSSSILCYESAGEIWASQEPSTGDWSNELCLSGGTGNNHNPSVTVLSSSSAFAVWERQSGTTRSILVSKYVSGTWQSPVTVSSFTENAFFESRPVLGQHLGEPSSLLWIAFAKSNGNLPLFKSTNGGTSWTQEECFGDRSPSIESDGISLPMTFIYGDEVYLTSCDWTTGPIEPRQLGKTADQDPLVEAWRDPILLPASTEAFYSEQWNEGELVWNSCSNPQVSSSSWRTHVTWMQDQMYLIGDFAADVKYLVHQSRDNEGNLSAGTAWQFEYWQNVSAPSIDRWPRITASADGTLLETTCDQYGSWSSWDTFGNGSNPALPLPAASRYVMTTPEGSLYRINPGVISLNKSSRPTSDYSYARVIVACDTSTGESFSLRMSQPTLSGRSVPFSAINDTLPGVNVRNFLSFLTTDPVSVSTDADTLSFSLTVSGKAKRALDLVLTSEIRTPASKLGTVASLDADLTKPAIHRGVKSVLRNLKGKTITTAISGSLGQELGPNWVFSVVHVYDTRKAVIAKGVNDPATEMTVSVPDRISLSAYPNPFNPETVISFALPSASDVDIRVFDVLGREVSVLHGGMLEAGTHQFTFNGSRLGSGAYFCRLSVRNADDAPFHQTLKILLQK